MDDEHNDHPENEDVEIEEEVDEEQFYEEDPNAVIESSYLLTPIHSKDAVSIAISPTGKYIATGGCDDICLLFQPSHNMKIPWMVYKASDTVSEIVFDSKERFLAFSSGDELNVVDLTNFVSPRNTGLDADVSLITWNPNTTGTYDENDFFLATVAENKYIAKFQVEKNAITLLFTFYYAGETPTAFKVLSDSSRAIISFDNGLILLFDIDNGTQISALNMKTPIHSTELALGNSFAVGLAIGKVAICSYTPDGKMKTVAKLGDMKAEEVPVEAICISSHPTRHFLAMATLSGDIEVHDLNSTSGIRFKYSTGETSILRLAFDQDVNKLYAGSYDGTFYVFDVHSDKLLDIYYSRGKINTFAFSMLQLPTGSMLGCSVSSKGHLRYFIDPFPEDQIKLSN